MVLMLQHERSAWLQGWVLIAARWHAYGGLMKTQC
jgi:hypothetical protein